MNEVLVNTALKLMDEADFQSYSSDSLADIFKKIYAMLLPVYAAGAHDTYMDVSRTCTAHAAPVYSGSTGELVAYPIDAQQPHHDDDWHHPVHRQ